MDSVDEIMQLCRLCLVKDEVNTPIFEEEGDIRQIFLKISACLPVKVSKEDNLPKNICDGCSCKLEALYQFWNTSANSEKKLMKWLSQGGIIDKSVSDKHSMNIDPVILKQEVVEVPDDRHSPDDDLVSSDLNVSNDADEYLIQQQQLPYQNVEFQFQQDEFDQTGTDPIIAETGTPSRKRRAAAIRAMANMGTEEEANPDLLEPKIAKTEEESEDSCNEDPEPTTFVGLPSATDNEQAGPSGVGKPAADPPFVFTDTDTIVMIVQNYKVPENERVEVSNPIAAEKSDDKVPFKCSRCAAVFWNRSILRIHQSRHSKSVCGRMKCDNCEKIFTSIGSFKTHRDLCENPPISKISKEKEIELPFFCCCRQLFSNHKQLWLHLRACYSPICTPKFYCNFCKKSYTGEARWVHHYANFHSQPLSNLFLRLRKTYKCCVSSSNYSSDLLKLIKHNAHCPERMRHDHDLPKLKQTPLKTHSKNKSARLPRLQTQTSDIITLDDSDKGTGSRTSPVPTKPRIFVKSLEDLKKRKFTYINTDCTVCRKTFMILRSTDVFDSETFTCGVCKKFKTYLCLP